MKKTGKKTGRLDPQRPVRLDNVADEHVEMMLVCPMMH